jgi:prophage regulatory protein
MPKAAPRTSSASKSPGLIPPAPRAAPIDEPLPPADIIVRFPEAEKIAGACRSSIYAWVKAGTFPAPIKLGPRSVGFRLREIDAWIASRSAASYAPEATR